MTSNGTPAKPRSAYLEASPQAQNCGQVQTEINRLDLEIEAKTKKLLEEVLASARELPQEWQHERDSALTQAAFAQALTGRVSDAIETVKPLDWEDRSWSFYYKPARSPSSQATCGRNQTPPTINRGS